MFIESLLTSLEPRRVLHFDATPSVSQVLAGACPYCRGDLVRIHRCPVDRALSLLVPVRRFRCRNCVWEGLATRSHWRMRIDSNDQVPTRNGAVSLRKVAMTESATIFPVLGFSDGTFSIENVKCAESESTSMV